MFKSLRSRREGEGKGEEEVIRLWKTPANSLVPTGNHEATSSTFSTFQSMNLTQGRCQDLGCGGKPSMQALKEQEVQLSPRATHTVVSRNLGGNSCLIHSRPLEDEGMHMNPCQNESPQE